MRVLKHDDMTQSSAEDLGIREEPNLSGNFVLPTSPLEPSPSEPIATREFEPAALFRQNTGDRDCCSGWQQQTAAPAALSSTGRGKKDTARSSSTCAGAVAIEKPFVGSWRAARSSCQQAPDAPSRFAGAPPHLCDCQRSWVPASLHFHAALPVRRRLAVQWRSTIISKRRRPKKSRLATPSHPFR